MNCRGDDDVDAKRSRPSTGKTRDGPRDTSARAFGWDPISGSHQGQQPQRLHREGASLYAKNRPHTWLHPNASQKGQIHLAPRAPSIHGPSVWTGRALQAESDDLESWSCASVSGLLMEPLSSWPSWISARARSHSRLGPEGHMGHLITNALARPFSPSPLSDSQTSAGKPTLAFGSA